jgi:hypothetical protein
MLILIVCLCINNKAEINQYLNSVIKKENHSQSTYDITISEDNSYPAWGEYDYSIEKLKIIKKGFFRNYIYVQVKNGGLCTAHAEYGWFSLTAKSCWAKWYFFNLKREVVDIVLRVADDSPEPGARYKLKLDFTHLGDFQVPATNSWYLVTFHNVLLRPGIHTIFLGTYNMNLQQDYFIDFIKIGDEKIEGEEYWLTGGNAINRNLRGLNIFPKDVKLQLWDGDPNRGGRLFYDAVLGKKQVVIDSSNKHLTAKRIVHYIENNGKFSVEIPWFPVYLKASHTIYAVIDPNNDLKEINEKNNQKNISVNFS